MKRIVIDARRLRGTTGRYHRELLTHLEKIDTQTDYHVLIHTKDQGHWTPTNQNFTMHVVKWDYYTFGEQLGMALFIRKLRPDLVHFLMPQQPLLYFGKRITSILDLTLLRFENIDKNRFIYKIEKSIFKFLLWNVAKRSEKIIVISDYIKKDLQTFVSINPSKVTVTKLAASELKKVKPSPIKQLSGKDYVFFVGNAFPHKNLSRLVEAFIKLKDKHPKLHLAFAGKKDFFHDQLEKKHGHVPDIHFLGYVEETELAWLYKHAQAYVFPSLSEGFGLPGLEVMQYGVPLVSSNATCLPEIYGDAAHYFDPLSVSDMARAIEEVLRSKARRESLIKAGNSQYKRYSWDKTAQKTHSLYFDVLEP